MPDADALDPFAVDLEGESEEQQAGDAATLRAAWKVPERVTLAPGVDLSLDDPSLDGKRRRCIALTKAGARCSAPALGGGVVCTAHAGRLDASAGGHARAQRLRLVREEAEDRMVQARMGARSIIAAKLIERATDLRKAVDVALDSAVAGERGSAKDLLGYLALAFPAQPSEQATPQGEAGELTTLSTDELRALAFGPEPRSEAG